MTPIHADRIAAVALIATFASCQEKPQDPARGDIPPAKLGRVVELTDPPTTFAEFRKLNDDDAVFEVAIVEYALDSGARVSLIGSVHIADAKHYAELNEEFTRYDALLYELVAPPDYRPGLGERRSADNPLTMLQLGMKRGLELEFQLGSIDYTKKNFVHADLTPEGFTGEMERRGESILSNIFDMIGRSARAMSQSEDEPEAKPFDIVKAFRSNEGRHTLRLMVAEQLMMLESMAAGAGDPDGSVLLEGRNDHALKVLRERLDAGMRYIGIYYGAAHMPDFETKLLRDFGAKKVAERRLVAWDIHKRPDKPVDTPK